MTLFTVLFFITFFGCFAGAIVGVILDNSVISISCGVGVFATILVFFLIDKLVKCIKSNNVRKYGIQVNAKVVGATFGGRKRISIGSTYKETVYYTPIFVAEGYSGNTKYTALKTLTGEDLQKLSNMGEVHITVYKNYCVIEENLAEIPAFGSVAYLSKDISLDEHGSWIPKKLNAAESFKQKNKSHTIIKVGIAILIVISTAVIAAAIALGIFGFMSEQYGIIIACALGIIFTVFTDVKIIRTMSKVLTVDKNGTPSYATTFTADMFYSHSTNGPTSTNYIVKFSYVDSLGNVHDTEEYVIEEVYYRVLHLTQLPIKVYKNYAAINQDELYL